MPVDFLAAGNEPGQVQASGDVAAALIANGSFDPVSLRPWQGRDGRSRVAVRNGKYDDKGNPQYVSQVTNAPATLRKDEWQMLDQKVLAVQKKRVGLFDDIRASDTVRIPNGMATTVFQWETQSDVRPASVDMDVRPQGDNDRPVYELQSMPLPIVHYDFEYSARQIAASRQGGSPLDTSMAALATRRCIEEVEKMTTGTSNPYSYAGGSIYGLSSFPDRITRALTTPTGVATNQTTLSEVLAGMQLSRDSNFFGPWNLYVSTKWAQYLDNDYATEHSITLRNRLLQIEGISKIREADYLPDFDMVLVQQTEDVSRALIGMEFVVVPWDTMGGMVKNFKVMGIQVPQFRSDQNGNTGIVHMSTP